MLAPNISVNSQPNTLMRREPPPPAFGTKAASSLQVVPPRPHPLRIAVIGITFRDNVELQPSQPIYATRSPLSTEGRDCWWEP